MLSFLFLVSTTTIAYLQAHTLTLWVVDYVTVANNLERDRRLEHWRCMQGGLVDYSLIALDLHCLRSFCWLPGIGYHNLGISLA